MSGEPDKFKTRCASSIKASKLTLLLVRRLYVHGGFVHGGCDVQAAGHG
jgi:hypothetical protein